MYYNSIQVAIVVYIEFMHTHDRIKDEKKVMIDCHLDRNYDHTHSTKFVQGLFIVFYDSLRERYVRYNHHIM